MKIILVCFLFFFTKIVFFADVSRIINYSDFCEMVVAEDEIFQNFKRNPSYQVMLEHVTQNQGRDYLKIITERYPFMLTRLEKYKENDQLGNPLTYFYGDSYGYLSPTTLRYMKAAGEMVHLLGSLQDKKIVEIGIGYGGLCKIISDLTGFISYTLVDLPEVCALAEKYLELLDVKDVVFFNNKEVPLVDSYDLVISNYAFSELLKDEQMQYIEKIINRSDMGYMTCNFTGNFPVIKSLTLEELISLIKRPNRNIMIFPEEPITFPDDIKGSSLETVIVVWSNSNSD